MSDEKVLTVNKKGLDDDVAGQDLARLRDKLAKVKDGSFWSLATRIDLIENAMKSDRAALPPHGLSMAEANDLRSEFFCALKSTLEEFLRAELFLGETREARLIALARQLDQREDIVASGPRRMIEELGSTTRREKQLRRARALVLVEILNEMLKDEEGDCNESS